MLKILEMKILKWHIFNHIKLILYAWVSSTLLVLEPHHLRVDTLKVCKSHCLELSLDESDLEMSLLYFMVHYVAPVFISKVCLHGCQGEINQTRGEALSVHHDLRTLLLVLLEFLSYVPSLHELWGGWADLTLSVLSSSPSFFSGWV